MLSMKLSRPSSPNNESSSQTDYESSSATGHSKSFRIEDILLKKSASDPLSSPKKQPRLEETESLIKKRLMGEDDEHRSQSPSSTLHHHQASFFDYLPSSLMLNKSHRSLLSQKQPNEMMPFLFNR